MLIDEVRKEFPFRWIISLFTTRAVLPPEVSGPDHGRQILQEMNQQSDPAWQRSAFPAWAGSCGRGLRSTFFPLTGFSEATCTAVHVCFCSFSLGKDDNCWPRDFKESLELPANASAAAHVKMEAAMGTYGVAVLLCRLKRSSVSRWTSENESFLQLSQFWWHCGTLNIFPSFLHWNWPYNLGFCVQDSWCGCVTFVSLGNKEKDRSSKQGSVKYFFLSKQLGAWTVTPNNWGPCAFKTCAV